MLAGVGVVVGFLTLRSLGKSKGMAVVLLGLIGLALSGYYYLQVDGRVRDIGTDFAVASIGAGIWMAIAGAIVVTLAGFNRANRRR